MFNLCSSTSSFVSSGISPSLPAISSKFLQISLNNIINNENNNNSILSLLLDTIVPTEKQTDRYFSSNENPSSHLFHVLFSSSWYLIRPRRRSSVLEENTQRWVSTHIVSLGAGVPPCEHLLVELLADQTKKVQDHFLVWESWLLIKCALLSPPFWSSWSHHVGLHISSSAPDQHWIGWFSFHKVG